jgi:hypothetical protein
MRAAAERADRFKAVRDAARGWRRAGTIDESTLLAVETAYPDDRRRLGRALRALSFVFTTIGLLALAGFMVMSMGGSDRDGWIVFLMYGLVLVGLTEWQLGPMQRSEGGTEVATSLVGIGCVLAGSIWLLDRAGVQGGAWETLAWACALVLFAAAAARWGMEAYAVAAAVCLFGLLSRFGSARLLFVLAALPLLATALAGEVSPRLAPSHRRGAVGVQAVAVAALYAAVHLGGWDARLFERMDVQPYALRPLFVIATAVLPLLLIGAGIRMRRRALLAFGVLTLVASLITVRFYVHVAPLWVVLLLSGIAAAALALLLERWLRQGPERQRGGFTADPLFDDERRLRAAEIAVAAAQTGPAAKRPAAPEFEAGGGKFGGGGATGEY